MHIMTVGHGSRSRSDTELRNVFCEKWKVFIVEKFNLILLMITKFIARNRAKRKVKIEWAIDGKFGQKCLNEFKKADFLCEITLACRAGTLQRAVSTAMWGTYQNASESIKVKYR